VLIAVRGRRGIWEELGLGRWVEMNNVYTEEELFRFIHDA